MARLISGVLRSRPLPPSQRNLKLANAVWSIEAAAPKFSSFIEQICCGDRELGEYLRVLIGYAATGYTSEQALFVFLGDGANGKSTLLNIVASVLGDYASSFDFSHLLHSDKSNVRSLEMLESPRVSRRPVGLSHSVVAV